MAEQRIEWWRQGAIYQLLIQSFRDSNGDGIGDLPGILQQLDYLQWLGVRALWLSPLHPSPLQDMGYDVTDYRDVHPMYGTLDDFDALVAETHRRDLKILLDWVPNHTSDQHPWFLESRSSRDNPRRDWYIWRDPGPDGALPNNWIANFGGSVWQWDEHTRQYYMHTFLPCQADLNWRNPEVQEAMLDVLRFWLDRGVDGFRVDATALLVKDKWFRDNPPNPEYRPGHDLPDNQLLHWHTFNQPLVHDILARCRRLADSYGGDRLLAGELYLEPEDLNSYYGSAQDPELHLPFNLLLPWCPWTADGVAELIGRVERCLPPGACPTWTINTHDCDRFPRRINREQARVAAMLLYTLRGVPTHYYGEEVGMEGLAIPPEMSIDPQGRRTGRNRDGARTPMQWDTSENAGFTTGNPWLPIGADYSTANVAGQQENSRSLLMLYRQLISLRRAEPALVHGAYRPVEGQRPLLVYRRNAAERKLLVALNFTPQPCVCDLADALNGNVLLSTHLDREGEPVRGRVELRGDEGLIIALGIG